ncbi:putative transcriptional regulatory protein [Fusarium oxysporum f. sp. cubense]|uniref:Putative transcriptional regulatory protein n=1 Tax=Fusarium oxysporum f. sp. cubense TaxID=61366 RepID=A0A559LI75_FUSOC|nr:putative transcriptional regulatory protein [Fusarium oxysporum f. sp. cubense]
MSGRAVLNPQHAQQSFDSGPQLYRDVPELHPVPSPSHSALMDFTHFDDFAFAYYGLPGQSSLISLVNHIHTFQSPPAAIPKSHHEVASSVTRPVVKPAKPGTVPSSKPTKKRGAEEAFGPDLEAWAKVRSEPKIEGDDGPSSLQVQEGEENKLQHEGTEALPSKEIQEHLAEVFFDNIYGQSYHLLHKPSYMRKLKNGTLPPVLVLTVCAVAARFTSNPLVNSSGPEFLRGEEWASHARDICTRRYEWPNLTILTCLLILGLHEFGTCQGGRSWALGYPRGLSDAEFMDPPSHKRKDSGADGVLEAKPELRSVEEYFTPPTPRRVGNKDTIRATVPKRKQNAKKQTGIPAQPGQHLDSLKSTDADAVSQERKFSGRLGLQITGATGFNPLAASNQKNPDFSTTMSPTSPANMTPFAHHAQTPTFFPPELLAINFGQGLNVNIDPLDRQLVYGGYSMDASTGLSDGHTQSSNPRHSTNGWKWIHYGNESILWNLWNGNLV